MLNTHNSRPLKDISHSQLGRLRHIDFKLYFMGTVNRTDLVSRFGIKEAAASRDLSLYKELAPNNIEYDTKAKTYIQRQSPSDTENQGFTPLFEHSDTQTLTALLYSFGDDYLGAFKRFIISESPTQLNSIKIDTLAVITRTIHQQKALQIQYYSLTNGLDLTEIVPSALVNIGIHCYVRAFDRKHDCFADFAINRIDAPKLINQKTSKQQSKDADTQWNHIVELELAPHPHQAHPDSIAFAFSMKHHTLKVRTRAALAGYLLHHWNVDCSNNYQLNSPEILLWLRNTSVLQKVENLHQIPSLESQKGTY